MSKAYIWRRGKGVTHAMAASCLSPSLEYDILYDVWWRLMSYRYILVKGFFPSGYVCWFFSMVSASWETVKHRRIKDGNRRQGKGHRFGLADLREVWVSLVLLSFWTWRKSRFKRSAKPCCVRLQLQPRFLLTKKLLPWVFPIQKTTALGSSYLKLLPWVLHT